MIVSEFQPQNSVAEWNDFYHTNLFVKQISMAEALCLEAVFIFEAVKWQQWFVHSTRV